MRSVVVKSPASTGDSPSVIIDQHLDPMNIGLAVQFPSGSAATCTVYYSLDDPFSFATDALYTANGVWYPVMSLTAVTTNTANTPNIPCRAFKLNNFAWTSGQPTLTVVQTGGIS